MTGDDNPYASPAGMERARDASIRKRTIQICLAGFLGLQAGGMLGLISACFAPFRYLAAPAPLDAVLMEDLSPDPHTQVLGESLFILVSCLVLGLFCGLAIDFGKMAFFASERSGAVLLLRPGRIRQFTWRGLLFALVGMAPAVLLLIAAFRREAGYFWLHGLWGLAHLLLAIYFGERFSQAYRRARPFPAA